MASPLFGIADTHVHFVSHLASGGFMVWGKPHPSNPRTTGEAAEKECLGHCDAPGGHGPAGLLPSLEGGITNGHLVGGYPEFDGWPKYSTLAHQQAFIEWIRRAYQGGLRLAVCLASNSTLLATRMSEVYSHGAASGGFDDMSAVRQQIAAMRHLCEFIERQEGGAGRGWMRIALTAEEAREIVAQGKLCMVMGVEVACLGNWKSPQDLEAQAAAQGRPPAALVRDLVEELFAMGVRYVFPLHATNNAFGGTALFVRNYDAANFLQTGSSFTVEKADPALGISYRLDEDTFTGGHAAELLGYYGLQVAKDYLTALGIGASVGAVIGAAYGAAGLFAAVGGTVGVGLANKPCPPRVTNWNVWQADAAKDTSTGGHINAQGLTAHGTLLISELLRRGMMIDIDHMGEKTTSAVLSICERHRYPVFSGHTGFRELRHHVPGKTFRKGLTDEFGTANARGLTREADKSVEQLVRIRNLGGFVSPTMAQQEGLDCSCGVWSVRNDAAGSSKSLAQAVLYAYERMGGENIGLGSDINGAALLPGPRFGPLASSGLRAEEDRAALERRGVTRRSQTLAQTRGVRYSGAAIEYRFSRFSEDTSNLPGAPFDVEERDFWQAIVMDQSGMRVETAEWTGQGLLVFDGGRQSRIANFAAGLRAGGPHVLPVGYGFNPFPTPLLVGIGDLQYSAYCIAHGFQPHPWATAEAKRLVEKLRVIWLHWKRMTEGNASSSQWIIARLGALGSSLYDASGRLKRSTAGSGARRRDFDVNMDGMAHYGMLPDLMEDLWASGTPQEPLEALYRSADSFVKVWRRCELGLSGAQSDQAIKTLLL